MSKNKTIIVAEPGKQELFITREFDAPRELVYRAHTEPEIFAQWLGPHDLSVEFELFEPVSGGRWRFLNKGRDGEAYGFHGTFHEVSPERIIQTFEFEGMPEAGHVSLETLTLEDLGNGRTKLITHAVYLSVADRDGMIQAGMESGVNDGYDKLDELLRAM
ncbi:MAG: SRPBCC family protein [Ardenticatenaceae bacterium]|nr:SRPBCC family protein [Anaerolineales bacterium]MCB8939732.1 SRPBCC family protein [Ardenticatenaceae bacterium]MCB8975184.1 SRPBCC family protein [Ardenticatenaceae bacterium]